MTRSRQRAVDSIHEAIVLFSRNARLRANETYNGMSFVAYAMLSYVGGRSEPTASDLAERYQLEKSTVSRQVAELESAGLLRRVPNPTSPRTKLLQLTDTGHQSLLDIRDHQRKGLTERLRDWPAEDITRFAELLQRFVEGE